MNCLDINFWSGKRVFLTGHTGFKGSWLSLWLQSLGVDLYGFALAPPTTPALFHEANVAEKMHSIIGDVRDYSAVAEAVATCKPDVIIHMAAQPLVRHSYEAPVETYAVNVMGTVHVLESARQVDTVRAVVNVTSDKCYENEGWIWGYREIDPMGGHDPYSSSKGCSELVTNAYRKAFFQHMDVPIATARAGNVVGGGDWATDRLVPDILSAFEKDEPVVIRNPNAVRPWQHVLEPLSGYLMLAERLYSGGSDYSCGWNFGPYDEDACSVRSIVDYMVGAWGQQVGWTLEENEQPHEANYLKLDISKAISRLGWKPIWNVYNCNGQSS